MLTFGTALAFVGLIIVALMLAEISFEYWDRADPLPLRTLDPLATDETPRYRD